MMQIYRFKVYNQNEIELNIMYNGIFNFYIYSNSV